MWWEQTFDYLNAFIGAVIIFASIIFIPEIRKNRRYRNIAIVLCVLLALLGFNKVYRDGRDRSSYEAKATRDSLQNNSLEETVRKMDSNIIFLSSSRSKDSLTFAEFVKNLEKIGWTRNPETNQPINYNTNIHYVDKLHIGPSN